MIKKFTLLLLAMLCIAGTSKADLVSTGEVTTEIPLTSFTANAPATFDSSTGNFTTTTSNWESIGYWIGDGSTMYATSLVLTLTESKAMNMYVVYVDGTSSPDSGANSTSITLNVDPSKAIKAIYIRYTDKGTVTISKVEYKIANVGVLDLSQFDLYGNDSEVAYNTTTHEISPKGGNTWKGVTKWGAINTYGTKFVVKLSAGTHVAAKIRYYKSDLSGEDNEQDLGSTDGSFLFLDLDPTKKIHTLSIIATTTSPITLEYAYIMPLYLSEATTPSLTSDSKAPVVLYRSITANKWSTIVLPFDLPSSQIETVFGSGASVAEFTGGNESTLSFTTTLTGDKMSANQPYAIKVASDFSTATISDVTIVSATSTQNATKWDFVGNYTQNETVPTGSYYFKDNALHKAKNTHSKINGFRGYFTYTGVGSPSPAPSLNIAIDGTITGIKTVTDNEESTNNKFYNLSGQQIEKPTKGIYIKNGKKYIIK